MSQTKHVSYTLTVFEALKARDDFMTKQQLQEATKLHTNLVLRSLHHLRQHKAVDAITVDGVLWWFATPHTDDRIRVVQEKAHFTRRHRARKTTQESKS